MKWKLALVLLVAGTASANAWLSGVVGNDTGGIIPWSRDAQITRHQIAGAHCARYNKHARITSMHPRYGDYIGFTCYFPRGYDPARDWNWGTVISTLN